VDFFQIQFLKKNKIENIENFCGGDCGSDGGSNSSSSSSSCSSSSNMA
jgi:hypothetical protein